MPVSNSERIFKIGQQLTKLYAKRSTTRCGARDCDDVTAGAWTRWMSLAGGELISGLEARRSRTSDLLGMRLLHPGHHVDGRLRRHRLRQSNRPLLHGFLHPRSIGMFSRVFFLTEFGSDWILSDVTRRRGEGRSAPGDTLQGSDTRPLWLNLERTPDKHPNDVGRWEWK